MAVRRWAVHPDLALETQRYGVVPVVSRERLLEAVLDGVVMLDRSGGTLSVVVGRHPTDLPGEAVTTEAAVEWKSGPRAPADPEAPVTVLPDEMPAPEPPMVEPDPVLDGYEPVELEEEDVSAIPEALR